MTLRNTLLGITAVGASLSLSACGLGGDASVGEDGAHQQGTGGISSGGTLTGNGGVVGSTGGAVGSSGGSVSTGGAVGAGGDTGGEKCGNTVCAAGKSCCNASCGVCAGPNEGCTAIFCLPADAAVPPVCPGGVYNCPNNYEWSDATCTCVPPSCAPTPCPSNAPWSPTECKCVAKTVSCTTNADCHMVSNYCGGCNCLALGKNEKAPECANPVQCFADPCSVNKKTPACVAGACVAN